MKKIEKEMIKEVNKALRGADVTSRNELFTHMALSEDFFVRAKTAEIVDKKSQFQLDVEPTNSGRNPEECEAFDNVLSMYVNNGGILNYLSYDEKAFVRSRVAKCTSYKTILRRLIKDEAEIVRVNAYRNLFDTPEFITNAERDKLMKSASEDPSNLVREVAASHTYNNIDYQLLFINDSNEYVVATMLRSMYTCNDYILDHLVKHPSSEVRREVVRFERPKDLDILVHDKVPDVRMLIALIQIPKYNDILVHDESNIVRSVIANNTHEYKYFKILMHDLDPTIRINVARRAPKAIVKLMLTSEKNMAVRDAFSRRIEEEEKTKAAIRKKTKKVE
jgi:hypothetical protein